MLKTEGDALGFQHFPRDLANVNECKIVFDPSNNSCISNYELMICMIFLSQILLHLLRQISL